MGSRESAARRWMPGRSSVAGLAAVAGLAVLGVLYSVTGNLPWVAAISGQLVHSVGSIGVSGPPPPEPGWPKSLGFMLLSMIEGFVAARLVLCRSRLHRDVACLAGMSLALGLAAAGLPGLWALCLGQVSVAFTMTAQSVTLLALVTAWIEVSRRGRRRLHVDCAARVPASEMSRKGRLLAGGTVALVALVLVILLFQAIMLPVTEWDALIYHVAAARLWFLGRPSPPVHFGPSVGIELSGNYPPLYPAIALATSTVAGAFGTLWSRLTSPIAYLSVLLMVFGLARHWWGRGAAGWALLLLVGCPTLLIYSMEATNYMLLAALVVAAVVACEVSQTSESPVGWAVAGAVAGLAALTNYIGLMAVLAVCVALLFGHRHVKGRATSRAAAMALAGFGVMVAPWWIRDWALVGDPVYPLGNTLWHAAALNNPLYLATLAELKVSALGAWSGSHLPLGLAEAWTAISGRSMLAIGGAAGLAYGAARGLRGDTIAAWLSVVVLVSVAILLAPGWYWTRYLIPLLPVLALLAGRALWEIGRLPLRSGGLGIAEQAGRIVVGSTLGLAGVLCVGIGIALPVAGPQQFGVATPNLPGSMVDYLANVRAAGSPAAALWYTYSGDYLSWQWLNRHTKRGQVIATLDPRTLYLSRPEAVLYLDGRHALPLLRQSQPSNIEAYLRAKKVRWIDITESAQDPATYDPVMRLLPLVHYLGTRWFPLRAVFSVNDLPWLTEIFSVGGALHPVPPAVFPGFRSPPPFGSTYTISARSSGAEIQVPKEDLGARRVLRWEYCVAARGMLQMSLTHQGHGSWRTLSTHPSRCGEHWAAATLLVPSVDMGGLVVRLRAAGGPVEIRDVRVMPRST